MVHQINSLCEVLKLKQYFPQKKVVSGKAPFFVIGPICTPHSLCLNIGFWQSSFVGKCCVSVLVLSTRKQYSSILKKVFVFQKICFKVKVLKKFKIKTCQSLKRRAILKILSTFFGTWAVSVCFKMKPLRKRVFLCFDKNQLKFCCKTCSNVERRNHWYLPIFYIFQTYSFIMWQQNIQKLIGV